MLDTNRDDEHVNEARWAAGIRAGDMAVFEEVYLAYHRRLWEFAHRYAHSSDAAEDLVHDVFSTLWIRRAEFFPQASIRHYLFGAVRNRAVQGIRHAAVVRHAAPQVLEDTQSMREASGGQSDAALLNGEIAQAVRQALEHIPELGRQVLMLRWQQQMRYPEIAGVLGITEAAAKQQGSRAQRSLRPFFERLFGGEPVRDG